MSIVGASIKEVAVCDKCGAVYTDNENIELVRQEIKAGYAPCPNMSYLSCKGEMKITLQIRQI